MFHVAIQLEGAADADIGPEVQGELTSLLARSLSLPTSAVTLDVTENGCDLDSEGPDSNEDGVTPLVYHDAISEASKVSSPALDPMLAPPASSESAHSAEQYGSTAVTRRGPSLNDGSEPPAVHGLPGAGQPSLNEMAAATSLAGDSGHASSKRGDTAQDTTQGLSTASADAAPSDIYVAPASAGGSDNQRCGDEEDPCATLRYAVNIIGNPMEPLTAFVSVVLGPGVYGWDSCGANATRPMNISGAGSGVTRIDCQGTGQALVASDSLWLTGLTVTGGLVNVSSVVPESAPIDTFAAGGGGGVAVVWPITGAGLSLDVWDVTFENNSAVGVISGGNKSTPVLGGGGLYVSGGGNSSGVAIRSCSFLSNAVSVTDYTGSAAACGGGVCIFLGLAPSESWDTFDTTSKSLVGAVLEGSDVIVANNVVNCSLGCNPGMWRTFVLPDPLHIWYR